MRQNKSTYAFQNPLKYIAGQSCKRCGQPAKCAIVTTMIQPACISCGIEGVKRGYDVTFAIDNPTHVYKNKPVKFVEKTYEYNGNQYCTIEMINKIGKTQRQTVQLRQLTKLAPDGLDSEQIMNQATTCLPAERKVQNAYYKRSR